MAKKGVVALMACVFALCLALVGCGGGGDNADNNKAAFVGTWDLVEMSQDGQVTGSEDLETLKSLGLEVYVNFNEDGTMVLALFGEPMEGTWEAASATDGTIEMEGQSVSMAIADERLTFEQEGASLTFEKGEAKEAPTAGSDEGESATADEEGASESSEPEVTDEAGEPGEPEAAETADEGGESPEAAEVADEAAEPGEPETAEATDEAVESDSSSSSAAE